MQERTTPAEARAKHDEKLSVAAAAKAAAMEALAELQARRVAFGQAQDALQKAERAADRAQATATSAVENYRRASDELVDAEAGAR